VANNIDNLKIPTSKEAREYGRLGGIASGESRRKKATMKATLEMLLDEKYKNGKTYRELATLGLLKGAINGNAQNYKTILETLGELLQPAETASRVTIVNSLPKDDENESNN
jgi:hypothetical protein